MYIYKSYLILLGNTCADLPTLLENGKQITTEQNNYFYKDKVRYQCNIGYQVDGAESGVQELECQANGEWKNSVHESNSVLNCTSMCYPYTFEVKSDNFMIFYVF